MMRQYRFKYLILFVLLSIAVGYQNCSPAQLNYKIKSTSQVSQEYQKSEVCIKDGDLLTLDSRFNYYKITLCPGTPTNGSITIQGDGGQITNAFKTTLWEQSAVPGVYKTKVSNSVLQVFKDQSFAARENVARLKNFNNSKYSKFENIINFQNSGKLVLQANWLTNNFQVVPGFAQHKKNSLIVRTDNWRFARRDLDAINLLTDEIFYSKPIYTSQSEFSGAPTSPYQTTEGFTILYTFPTNENEWSLSQENEQMYLYYNFGNSAPKDLFFVPSTFDKTISIDLTGYGGKLLIKDLNITASSGDALHAISYGNIEINNVKISMSSENGMYISSTQEVRIINSTVTHSQANGILVTANNTHIENNQINSNGILGTQSTIFPLVGLQVTYYNNALIKNNFIQWSGNAGIKANTAAGGMIISNNQINYSCFISNDCGAIYLAASPITPALGSEFLITNNSINTVYGDFDGMYGGWQKKVTAGIYLDFKISGYNINSNSILNASGASELADVFGCGTNQVNQPSNTVIMMMGVTSALCNY